MSSEYIRRWSRDGHGKDLFYIVIVYVPDVYCLGSEPSGRMTVAVVASGIEKVHIHCDPS